MRVIVYVYVNPVLESLPDERIWGCEVDQLYQDLGDRTALDQLLDDCKTTPTDYLLIRQWSELGDSVEEVANCLNQLADLGVQVLALDSETDETLPLHRFQEISQTQRRDRIRHGHAKNRLKAIPPPGSPPYGYRRGKDRYILDRSTAPVVKEFFEYFLLYGSLRGAVRHLERKAGKKISVSTGRRWLQNPVYRGDTAYQNGDVISDTHTPILSREEAAQIDRLLRRNRPFSSRTASAAYSLTGLVVCGDCSSPLTVTKTQGRGKAKDYLYLRPLSCPKPAKCATLPYQDVLEATIYRICEDLPQAVSQIQAPDLDQVKAGITAQIQQKQAIVGQLSELITAGILDLETAQLRDYKLRTEISQLQSRLAMLPPVKLQAIAQTLCIPQFWLDLSEDERRFYFREFLQQIQLLRSQHTWQLHLKFIF